MREGGGKGVRESWAGQLGLGLPNKHPFLLIFLSVTFGLYLFTNRRGK